MSLSVFDAAAEAPERLALLAGPVRLSFGELAARVAGRLAELRGQDLLMPDGERPLAVVAAPTLSAVETLLAAFAARTPALLLHPRSSSAERAALIQRAGAALEPALAAELGLASALPAAVSDPHPASRLDAERIAALVPTSGTTGSPRLAELSERALSAAARASARHLGVEDDRWLVALPLAHVGGLMILVRSLLARTAIVLFDPAPSLLSRLDELVRTLRDAEITLLSLVPAVLERLLAPPHTWQPPASLRAVLVGGAPCPVTTLRTAHERGIPVLTTYGLTEACGQVATRAYSARWDAPRTTSPLAPAGTPLDGVSVRLSEQGVIELRGPALFSGYAGEPGSDPGSGWFTTRDRGLFTPDGEITISGRTSDLIITGGENVDPSEVEAALASVPGVLSACVVGVADPTFGEVVAALLVVTAGGPVPTLESLGTALRPLLASFKLPRRLLLVPELPLLPSGKIDRRGARARYFTLRGDVVA